MPRTLARARVTKTIARLQRRPVVVQKIRPPGLRIEPGTALRSVPFCPSQLSEVSASGISAPLRSSAAVKRPTGRVRGGGVAAAAGGAGPAGVDGPDCCA